MQEEIIAKLQEIIRLAYLYNQQGMKQVWVYLVGQVNALHVRIARFEEGNFVDVELEETIYLAADFNTDAEIISQLNAIIEKTSHGTLS